MNQLVTFLLYAKIRGADFIMKSIYILHSIFETSYYVKLCIVQSKFVISI